MNISVLLGKYHMHCSKWGNGKTSFTLFINDFKQYFLSLKKLKPIKSVRKMYGDLYLLHVFWPAAPFRLPLITSYAVKII